MGKEKLLLPNDMTDLYTKLIKLPKAPILGFVAFLKPGNGICYAGKKNVIVIDVNGNIDKCTVTSIDIEKASKSIIGTVENEENVNIDSCLQEKWISNKSSCAEINTCFFAPVCLSETCPKKRIFKYESNQEGLNRCPTEKLSLGSILQLLDYYGRFDSIVKD